MMRSGLALAAALVTGCSGGKSVVSKDAFLQAARDCHAPGASYASPKTKDGVPALSVVDATITMGGQQTRVSDCVARKIAPYRYGKLTLDAPPLKRGG